MTRFAVGKPVVTRASSVAVDAGLPVGRHRFRLEVVTNTGQRSTPDEALVQVQASIGPLRPSNFPTTPDTRVVLPGRTVSPAVFPSAVSPASTLAGTALPSTTSRPATPGTASNNAVAPSTTSPGQELKE